jgi:hypothetical protein
MKWTEEEIRFLRENYNRKVPLEFISDKLDRSKKSIQRKAQNLYLHREWVRFNKPILKQPQRIIDKRYYEKNREKVYQRKMNRRKRLKEEAIKIAGGKCKICGYNKCVSALEFHHNRENKENNVSTLLKNESRQKLLKEVGKCILLCANCHRETHYVGA